MTKPAKKICEMRGALIAVLIVLASPALAADYWQSDNLLACLVGKGAVAMRHGASAKEAIVAVAPECQKVADPPPKDQDAVDYSNYVSGVAFQMLLRAGDVM